MKRTALFIPLLLAGSVQATNLVNITIQHSTNGTTWQSDLNPNNYASFPVDSLLDSNTFFAASITNESLTPCLDKSLSVQLLYGSQLTTLTNILTNTTFCVAFETTNTTFRPLLFQTHDLMPHLPPDSDCTCLMDIGEG